MLCTKENDYAMSNDTMDGGATLEGLRRLWEASGPGLPDSTYRRRKVPLNEILTAPEVFQPRDFGEEPWKKKRHVEDLTKLIDDGLELDPITLFPVDGGLFVVDGHCRLEAYREAGWGEKRTVPARVLRGSFLDALAGASRENAKARLPLTQTEKSEHAWRLVRATEGQEWSCRDLARSTAVKKSTIGNMQKALREAEAAGPDPRDFTWEEWKRRGRGEVVYDEARENKMARSWANRMRHQLGPKPEGQPEVLLEALRMAYPNEVRAWEEEGYLEPWDGEESDF